MAVVHTSHGEGSCSVAYIRYEKNLGILSCGADGKIVLRSAIDTKKVIRTFSNPKDGPLYCLAVSPKMGSARFLTGADGEVRVSAPSSCAIYSTSDAIPVRYGAFPPSNVTVRSELEHNAAFGRMGTGESRALLS